MIDTKDALAVVPPGGTITGSVPIRLGNCYNPDCDHILGSSSHATGMRGNQMIMSEPQLDPECAYCGWTTNGAPTDPKWKKKRWPSQYAIELRERLHGENKPAMGSIPNDAWWGRVYNVLLGNAKKALCDHDWVRTGESWFEDFDKNPTGHYYTYPPDTHCENAICDKCGELGIVREKNTYTWVGGGWKDRPYAYRVACEPVPVRKHPQFTTEAEVKSNLIRDKRFTR